MEKALWHYKDKDKRIKENGYTIHKNRKTEEGRQLVEMVEYKLTIENEDGTKETKPIQAENVQEAVKMLCEIDNLNNFELKRVK